MASTSATGFSQAAATTTMSRFSNTHTSNFRATHMNLRRKQKEEQQKNLEQEIVISTWINELDLSLKSYDIVSLMRNMDDFQVQAN